MKLLAASMLTLSASVASAVAVPQLSNVSMTQDVRSRLVTITYTIDQPAVITLDVLTNGVSVGRGVLDRIEGSCDCRVEPGTYTFLWHPDETMPGAGKITLEKGGCQARLAAYAVDCPPDWMVADLRAGHEREIRYYATSNDVPGGITADIYKTDKLLMRKIPARNVEWMMGAPNGEIGWNRDSGYKAYAPFRRVTLTYDYYCGVYEVTQKQLFNVYGENTFSKDADKGDMRPVNKITWSQCRSAGWGTDSGSWPTGGHAVGDGKPLRKFRDQTGIAVDFPTAAEWEYACRAGSTRGLNSNKDVVNTDKKDDNVNEVAWNAYNSDGHTHDVGSKPPNAWGLYDMHGNVAEWILDNAPKDDATRDAYYTQLPCIDPVGVPYADRHQHPQQRFNRGGGYGSQPWQCRSSAMSYLDSNYVYVGFRLFAPAVAPSAE